MSGRKACSTGCSGVGCRKCDHLEKCGATCNHSCTVVDTVANKIIFVSKIRQCNCPFELPFGGAVICTCPIHKENYFN